jgi:two-component system alkaline phosphatase synthesis response regulator PhoP
MTPASRKVFIVEDEPSAADMFEEMMRISGYEVIKSHSSTPAMSIVRVEMPDVVILDLMMPDISGIEVLQFMRREPALRNIPVVIVSARGLPADIQAGMQAGASAYLVKPVGFDKLRETVERVIQSARDNEQNFGSSK